MSEELNSKTPPTDLPASTDDAAPGHESDEATPFVITLPDDPASDKDWYLWAGVLAILALVSFWPAITGQFLWDDDHHVSQNLALRTTDGLKHIWTPPIQTTQYYPLTHTTFWIEHHIWGNAPLGYHVVNLLLHAGSVILVWRILRRLAVPGAWVAAALWAVHPLQVESVAWISERKNCLSGLLFFASFWFYLEFGDLADSSASTRSWKLGDRWQAYALSLVLFVGALLSKTVTCSLPAILLIVLWWKNKLTRRAVLGTIPFFIIGLALAMVTSHREHDPAGMVRATGDEWYLGPVQKILVAGRDIWFYVGKLLAPINLSFNYRKIVPNPADIMQWLYVIAAVAVLAVLFAMRKRWGRGPLAAVMFYIAALFPSLGFVAVFPFRFSYVADHFQYLAGLGLIVLIVAGVSRLFPAPGPAASQPPEGAIDEPAARIPPVGQSVAAVLATALAIALAATSWYRSTHVFTTTASLWIDTLDKNPDSWLAAYNLAIERTKQIGLDIEDATQARRDSNSDLDEADMKDAALQATAAQELLHRVINNPEAPATFRNFSYNALGTIDVRRAEFPGVDPMQALASAQTQFAMAIDGEKQEHLAHPEASAYLSMGLAIKQMADLMEKNLPPDAGAEIPATMTSTTQASASTHPVMLPTTRPASPDEQKVVDKYIQAEDYITQAIRIANDILRTASPISMIRANADFALGALNRGKVESALASLALRRHDENEFIARNAIAMSDFQQSLLAKPDSVEASFRLGKCLELAGQTNEAQSFLIRAIRLTPQGRYAPGYFEIGRIRANLAMAHKSVSDLNMAIVCFKTALDLDPGFAEARTNLAAAEQMLDTARFPTTEPSTEPGASPEIPAPGSPAPGSPAPGLGQ